MQARWGSHGDYEIVCIAPSSPQEMFNYTIKAFNLAERFRIPVAIMSDAYLAQLKEKVVIPLPDDIEITPRRYFQGKTDEYLPFKRDKDFVPPMVKIGDGFKFHVTGLTHDDRGYPIMFEECQEYNVHPLVKKIRDFTEEIIDIEEENIEDAEIIIISYGSAARASLKAMEIARSEGLKVGSLKLATVWPFPEKKVFELARKAKAFIVPEMNFGQLVYEVERCSAGKANVLFLPHGENGVEATDEIIAAIKQALPMTDIKENIIELQRSG